MVYVEWSSTGAEKTHMLRAQHKAASSWHCFYSKLCLHTTAFHILLRFFAASITLLIILFYSQVCFRKYSLASYLPELSQCQTAVSCAHQVFRVIATNSEYFTRLEQPPILIMEILRKNCSQFEELPNPVLSN